MVPHATLVQRDDAVNTPIESKAQLVEYLDAGCKAPEAFRLGTEQETFVYRRDDYRSILRQAASHDRICYCLFNRDGSTPLRHLTQHLIALTP